jgi:hypothetical protein
LTIPEGIKQITVKAWGGRGGGRNPDAVVRGGYSYGVFPVKPGDKLYIFPGDHGQLINNGQGTGNGGNRDANGGSGVIIDKDRRGYGGGGASDVRLNGNELKHRLIVAGGGGGAALVGGIGQNGGAGGGKKGIDGLAADVGGSGGSGGSQTAPGEGKDGGHNANGGDVNPEDFGFGGGGGGGYFGGGAGEKGSGGGGGSGFISPTGTGFTASQDEVDYNLDIGNELDGIIIISW